MSTLLSFIIKIVALNSSTTSLLSPLLFFSSIHTVFTPPPCFPRLAPLPIPSHCQPPDDDDELPPDDDDELPPNDDEQPSDNPQSYCNVAKSSSSASSAEA